MKRLIAIICALAISFGLCACGQSDKQVGDDVSVFYYTYSDTYISSVRSEMDKLLRGNGISYQNYDANGNQTTQTEQVTTALAKGTRLIAVNVVDTGSDDAAKHIIDLASANGVPVVFFNRSVNESVVKSYDKCIFIGTDYEMAGHLQGEMIGNYLVENFDKIDLNSDGKISYVVFKGQEGNMEAIARTKYGVEDADKVLTANGKPKLQFYDTSNNNRYLVDQNGLWSSAAANDYMSTILAQYSETSGNMVELVIANSDEMALGAVAALQAVGYNKTPYKRIPVFGVDATDAAKEAVNDGKMTGTVKQDADGMAKTIAITAENYLNGKDVFENIKSENIVGDWRINIPYATYIGNSQPSGDDV